MTEQEAFLAAIRESPDDDTHRLVYADWLTDHGQEDRAEFIRVQCATDALRRECLCHECASLRGDEVCSKGPCVLDRPEHHKLALTEEYMLHGRWQDLISQDLAGPPGSLTVCLNFQSRHETAPGQVGLLFRRGFVSLWVGPARSWCETGSRLLAHHPVEEVRLTTRLPLRPHPYPANRCWRLHLDYRTASGEHGQAYCPISFETAIQATLIRDSTIPPLRFLEAREELLHACWPDVRQWRQVPGVGSEDIRLIERMRWGPEGMDSP